MPRDWWGMAGQACSTQFDKKTPITFVRLSSFLEYHVQIVLLRNTWVARPSIVKAYDQQRKYETVHEGEQDTPSTLTVSFPYALDQVSTASRQHCRGCSKGDDSRRQHVLQGGERQERTERGTRTGQSTYEGHFHDLNSMTAACAHKLVSR